MEASFLPKTVPGPWPGFLQVFQAPAGSDPEQCGVEAAKLIRERLPESQALLLQDLPVLDQQACATFVDAMDLKHTSYEPFHGKRKKVNKQLDTKNERHLYLAPVQGKMGSANEIM